MRFCKFMLYKKLRTKLPNADKALRSIVLGLNC